jgi:arylamine N-acetyltransferase
MAPDFQGLSEDQRDEVLEALGFGRPPPPSLVGLESLYAAWLDRIPFCSSLKRIHYGSDPTRPGPLPLMAPADYFQNFLEHGTGGTCFPTAEAFFALTRACGYPVRRAIGSMIDFPQIPGPNHGTVVADFDGSTYLVDPFWGSRRALRLDGTAQRAGPDHLKLSTFSDLDDDQPRVQWRFHTSRQEMRFAFSPEHPWTDDAVDADLFRDRYEASSGPNSVFNACLYISRHAQEEVHTIYRGTYFVLKPDNTIREEPVDNRNELLTGVFGLSEQLVAQIPPDLAD